MTFRPLFSTLAAPLAIPLAFALSACISTSSEEECTDPNTPGCLVASAAERIKTPEVPAADLDALVTGNTAFALNLYQQIRPTPGNLFYSPFSISEALAMTWAGARGDTEKQMATALSFTLSQDKIHPAFDALDLALASRGQGKMGSDGGAFRLNVANALWGQTGYSFQAPFLSTLATNYGAGMRVVDFIGDPDKSRLIINDWVASKTEDRITDLLKEGAVKSSTRLYLTNTVYFNARWAKTFNTADTKDAAFTLRDGTAIKVPTMSAQKELRYSSDVDYAAVELPYDGEELSMILIQPTAATPDAFEASLTPVHLQHILDSRSTRFVTMTLPRFKIEAQLSLADQLGKLGMPIAFSDHADFSGIHAGGGLAISAVIHKAFVDVNETGTEAAASTAVSTSTVSLPTPAEIHLDHPYLFLIRDNATKAILFLGRVDDPRG